MGPTGCESSGGARAAVISGKAPAQHSASVKMFGHRFLDPSEVDSQGSGLGRNKELQ